ncbi:MAG: short-chain dehydrogenase/reductase [Sphingomonadales bacterium]|jgi:3-oxoacyl-[acyl-carrier protein] reductase|nr:short-chain dehydrogenase/reductase [Sphingomonadales bacterium]
MNAWEGKVAFVTGGGSGIGRAFAQLVAQRGGSVVIADINADAAEETAQTIGTKALAIGMDVSNEGDVANAIDRATRRFGRIDMLHNNASLLDRNGAIEDMTIEAFRRVLDVNILGTFLCARAVTPIMKRNGGGSIVNMSSRGGLRGQGHTLAYSTTKAGIVSFTRGLAEHLRPWDIRVNALSVGLVETKMTRGGAYLETARKEGRYVFQPEEMAIAIAWLADKDTRTGAVLEYFGGDEGPQLRELKDFAFDALELQF